MSRPTPGQANARAATPPHLKADVGHPPPVFLAVLLPLLSRRHPLSEQIIEFLGALERQIKWPLLIVWDGVVTHRSRLVKA